MQNSGKEMYKKKCAARAKLVFLLIRPIVVFHLSPALPWPLSITRFYILFEQTINIIETFAFSLAKSIYYMYCCRSLAFVVNERFESIVKLIWSFFMFFRPFVSVCSDRFSTLPRG